MPGLTGMIDLSSKKTDQITFEDGEKFSFAITSKDSGNWSGGKATGNALRYEAPQDGVFTLYGYSVSDTKTFYVVKEGVTDYKTGCTYKEDYTGTSVPIKYSMDVKKGDVYYFFIAGSKMRFCSAKLEEYEALPTTCPTEQPSTDPIIKNLTVIKNGDVLNVSFKAENMPEGQGYVVAGYEGERLKALTSSAAEAAQLNSDGITNIKVFIWKSVSGMEPICAAAEVKAE